VSGSVFL